MIKKIQLSLLLAMAAMLMVNAQAPNLVTGTSPVNPVKNFGPQSTQSNPNYIVTGATDTLDYFFNKHYYRNPTTPPSAPANLQFLTINSPYPGTVAITHCGAVFLNSTNITVNGLEGIVARRPASPSSSVTVRLYLCNVNSLNLPVLPALDSVQTTIGATTGNWVGANFTTPISISGKFAVLFKCGSATAGDTISLFLNNACNATSTVIPAQRFGEGLGVMRYNGNFYSTTGIFGNGPPGNDYEFIVAARVGFGFSAGVSAQTSTICTNSTGSFYNTSTPTSLIENRQFNFNKFGAKWGGSLANSLMPPTDSIYNWTFTGSTVTGTLTTYNSSANFNTAGNQVATLNVKYRKSASNAAFLTTVSDVATATINVSNQLSPVISISGAGPVCSGSSATLIASGNSTYTWTSPSSNASSIVVTPVANTIYTVSGNNQGCIGTQTALVSVATNPTLNVTGPSNICLGSSYTLNASGASSYLWSNSATSSSIVASGSSAGVQAYTVTGTNAPCAPAASVINVTVNALPSVSLSATFTHVCTMATSGTTIALTGSPSGGTYSGVNVASGIFTPNTAGTFVQSYSYTDPQTNCSKTASSSVVVANCTGLQSNALNARVLVAPNPASNGKTLIQNLEGNNTIMIYNMLGTLVASGSSDKSEYQLDFSGLAGGNYFVRITDSNGQVRTIKIVNQNQ